MLSLKQTLVLTWAVATIATIASASNMEYQVRGVLARSLQMSRVLKSEKGPEHQHIGRSYPAEGEFPAAGTSKAKKESGVARSAGCKGAARSADGVSKTAKGVSEAAGNGNRRRRERGLKSKSKSSGAVATSAGVECDPLKASVKGVPDREYPPVELMATTTAVAPKGKKGSAVSDEVARCARDGSNTVKSKAGTRRTRGLKKIGVKGAEDTLAVGGDDCIEGAALKTSKGKQTGSDLSGGEYPPPVETAGGVATPESEIDASLTSTAQPLPMSCADITQGVIPADGIVYPYELSANMEITTTNTYSMDSFLGALQSYLQTQVAPLIAGCAISDAEGTVTNTVTGVEFKPPRSEPSTACQGRRMQSGVTRQGETVPPINKPEDPVTEYPAPDYPVTDTAGEGEAAALGGSGGCNHVVVPVDIYHSVGATPDDIKQTRTALVNAISDVNMMNLLGVTGMTHSEVADLDTGVYSTEESAASIQVESDSSGMKIGFSVGIMVVIILVSLAALKVAYNRKRTVGVKRLDMDEGDDKTFVYPTEDELLGPEFDDSSECAEPQKRRRRDKHDRHSERKRSAYNLEDIHGQDSMSVESGSSYGSSRHHVSFRQVVATPSSLYRKGCC